MAQSADEIAKDIVVAWLSHNTLTYNDTNRAKDLGKLMGEMYTAVLQAVREGFESDQPSPQGATVVIEGLSR